MKREIRTNKRGNPEYRINGWRWCNIGDIVYYYDKEIIKVKIDDKFADIYNDENIIYFSTNERYLKTVIADKIYGVKHMNNIPEVGERVVLIEKTSNDDHATLVFESGMSVEIRTYHHSYYIKPYKIELDVDGDNRGRYYNYVDNNRDEIKKKWKEELLQDSDFIEEAGKLYMAKLRRDKISKLNEEEK